MVVGGRAIWEGTVVNKVANLATDIGLFHSLKLKMWEPKRRRWHVQLRKEDTPLYVKGLCDSWADVEQEMLRRFNSEQCPHN